MVMHTDEPHPHVHLVVRAVGSDGRRLRIRKATLRAWRLEFARHLRERGVAANATETSNIAILEQRGARADLRRCGAGHICVRVDLKARYGEHSDYLVIRGY